MVSIKSGEVPANASGANRIFTGIDYSNEQDCATAKPKEIMGEKNANALFANPSHGSMKTSLAMNMAPEPKPSNGCSTTAPESTRNLKPVVSTTAFPTVI